MSFLHFHPRWLCIPTPKPTGEKLAKCLEKTNKLQNAVSFFQSKFFLYETLPQGGCERCNTFYLSVQFSRGHSTTTWTEFCHPAWTVFIPWAWTKTYIFWPPPSCPRSYWMAPKLLHLQVANSISIKVDFVAKCRKNYRFKS